MGALNSHDITRDTSRVIWRWEYLPNMFDPYPPEISAIIERYFLSDFSLPFIIDIPNTISHIIDLSQMVQTSTHSNIKRRIVREISQDPRSYPMWSWENDLGEMEAYSPENSHKIEASSDKRDVNFTHVVVNGKEYWIDIKNLHQISISSMKKRRIERNIIPDHRFIWQWQADNGRWINYSDNLSRKIEADYFLRPDCPLAVTAMGRRCFIDPKRMCEINESDGNERPIRRILENYIRYKWLWKDEFDKWHSFSPYLMKKFEENYLDPSAGLLTITLNNEEFDIDTSLMLKRNKVLEKTYKIKRQALPNDFAVWGWSTKPGTFKTFSPSASKLIEAHYVLNDPSLLEIKFGDKKYHIDIRTRTKTNLDTNGQKKIERRLLNLNFPPNLDLLPKTECSKAFRFLAQTGHLPEEWDNRQKEEIQTFQASDGEWNMLSEKFHATMNSEEWVINNICRIQNVVLMNSFILNKMIQKLCYNEYEEPELLFFMADTQKSIETLYEEGENPLAGHFSPISNYGKGYYFTKSARSCRKYSWGKDEDKKIIICFLVLVGKTVVIKPGEDVNLCYGNKYNTWSDVRKAPQGIDCIRAAIEDEEVFVVYDAEKCYPLYTMEFTDVKL